MIEPANIWTGRSNSLRIVPVKPVVDVFPCTPQIPQEYALELQLPNASVYNKQGIPFFTAPIKSGLLSSLYPDQ